MFYLDLFRALQEEKVRYLVVGGVAVNLHGIGRLTVDVDLMLALDAGNLGRFVAVARSPLDRLRWLDEARRFTQLARGAPLKVFREGKALK